VKQESHFTSKGPASDIISKIEEAAKPLGFEVQRQEYKVMHMENVINFEILKYPILIIGYVLCFLCVDEFTRR
jgi:hypothetical protein